MSHADSRAIHVVGGRPLSGTARVPPDLEVLERALLLASLGNGTSQLLAAASESNLAHLATALHALGVPLRWSAEGLTVEGVGLWGLRMPTGALDCGRSFTSLALVAGALSGQPFGTRVTAHPTLAARSVESIVGPLRARGAHIAGHVLAPPGAPTPPISVAPLVEGEALHALECTLPFPDAAAKTAVLVSALYARGTTTLTEPIVSADHMERLLVALGLPLRRIGTVVHFDAEGWDREVSALGTVEAPGCATCAAFACAAALLVPHSRIALAGAGYNPSRSGFLDVMRLWNAEVQVLPRGDAGLREPVCDVVVKHGALRGGVLGGELLLRTRGELAALAVLGSVTQRELQLYDIDHAATDSDPQAAALEGLLRAFGLQTHRPPGVLSVRRGPPRSPARVSAHEDPELAMAAVVLGLTSEGETVVEQGARAIELAHPGFFEMVRALGAEVHVR